MGSETSNADIVERMINAWNTGNLDLAASFIAPDGINHSPPTEGISAWRQSWVKAREMFPDMRVRIEQTVSQGDTVCHRYTMMATAPNGRKVEILGLDMVRVRDGKIVEHWALADSAGLAARMG